MTSRHFGPAATTTAPTFPRSTKLQKSFDSDSDTPTRGKQADKEGIPDYYRLLLDRVKAAGPEGRVREDIINQLSPDWRAGHLLLQGVLEEWSQQPAFMPRVGEIVLFTRALDPDDKICWDADSFTLKPCSPTGWREHVRWEAGVVTQLPTEPISEDDLLGIPGNKTQSIAYSGFRVEPLSEPGSRSKSYTSQHKYVPLHGLRPFSFFKECLGNTPEEQWHPTIKHALTVSSSFSLLGKYALTGSWPEATLFCRGVYLGPELIMIGDLVRIEPMNARQDSITDVMAVTSIRLRFVKLDEASDDDYDDGPPYTTCLHIAGKAYTLDPKRSFGGIAASPARPNQSGFPTALTSYGNWFHVTDPQNPRQKLELPYTRVLDRCIDKAFLQQWFQTPPQSSTKQPNRSRALDISRGRSALREARAYSREHDARIVKDNGQTWYWGESRIEQLDLYEINGRFVGEKDATRNKKQVTSWRQALKVLDGKKGGLDEYFAAKRQREEQQKAATTSSAWGMMGSAAREDSASDGEALEDEALDHEAVEGDDAMVVDKTPESPLQMLSIDGDEDNQDDDEDELMIIDG